MRILILSNDHMYSNIALKDFLKENHKDMVGIIFPDFVVSGKSFLQSVGFLLKKKCGMFYAYKWFEDNVYRIKTLLGLGKLNFYSHYSKKYDFPIFKTLNINDEETIKLIKKLKPDVIYSVSYPQKIKEEVLKIPKKGCINFHDSLLPQYRGMCAYFWITANNEKKGGVTAHYIDKELDTGEIVLQKEYNIASNDSMQKTYYKSSKLIGKMIFEVHNKLKEDKIKSYHQKNYKESYFSWPNDEGQKLFKKNKKKIFRFVELWNSI